MKFSTMIFVFLLIAFQIACTEIEMPEGEVPEKEVPEEVPENISGNTFYVAPDGKDSNPGTLELPWATWTRAFTAAKAGDIVYFRGGVYKDLGTQRISGGNPPSGTEEHPIRFYNYPGEEPILDNGGLVPTGGWNTGLTISNVKNVHYKGLTIRNCHEHTYNVDLYGFNFHQCENIVLENLTASNNGGPGFGIFSCKNVYVLNCDAFNNIDTFNTSAGSGGTADGFQIWNIPKNTQVYMEGCRAWGNSDDGYDTNASGLVVFDRCWAIDNGRLEGSAAGFKWGLMNEESTELNRHIVNCISAFNRGSAYNENNRLKYLTSTTAYNNISYANQYGFVNFRDFVGGAKDVIYKNNLTFRDIAGNLFLRQVQQGHNSWNLSGIVVSEDDFVSLDSTGITGPRQEDGSLPELDFLKLVAGSDLIDAGVDVGIPFYGSSPDIGFSEFNGTSSK